ncbi:hypothetical protein [Brevibacillus brevis]|uniref:Uncharacterized protein n=1 Tax=Brevibacillus brevis TaxID=1393 RepID=A0A517I9G4_BREBE|nr:hypothetical protein [Brevibacillus brevis]QDS35519.1 hypothetical protein FPS98_16715 [Brevibacillus brevis]
MEKELYNFFMKGDQEKATYLLIILVTIWLFKEMRSRYIQFDDSKTARFDKTLEIYGALEVSIVLYLKEQNETTAKNLYECISRSYSALSRNIHKLVSSFLETHEVDKLIEILVELRKESSELKYEQSRKTYQLNNTEDYLGYYWNHFKTFFVPVFLTFVTVVVILFSFVFSYNFLKPEISWMTRINLFALIFSGAFLLFFVMTMLDMLMAKRFKHSWKNWLIIIGIIMIVIFSINFESPIISAIFIVIFSMFFMPKLLKRT